MLTSFFLWLFQASVAIVLLAACYKLLLEKLTFFEWNRVFLLGGMLACMIVPLLPSPYFLSNLWANAAVNSPTVFSLPMGLNTGSSNLEPGNVSAESFNWLTSVTRLMTAVYFSGVIYKTLGLIITVAKLLRLKKSSTLIDTVNGIHIFLQDKLPSFSFFNNIFINENHRLLSQWEIQQILFHEQVHITQKHSYDVIFYEIVGIVFWFNLCVGYLGRNITQVHEYLVDRELNLNGSNSTRYGELLIKLATHPHATTLIHTFSDSQIFHRITMLTKPKSNPMQKLKFLTAGPMVICIAMLSSFITQHEVPVYSVQLGELKTSSSSKVGLKIANITWVGNTRYTSEQLNNVLGIKVGDSYDSLLLENRLANANSDDITSLYMDQGYLFFRTDVITSITGNQISIQLKMDEGQKARIGKLIVKGNKKASEKSVLAILNIKTGEYFNKSKLIKAQQALSKSGKFDPTSIEINPIPDHKSFESNKEGIVDFEFVVKEL
jgi:beta-lactamase regulating signal transducer with metallopeptidase domain